MAVPKRRGLLRGEGPWPWLTAGSVAVSLLMLGALLLLLATRGLGHFWPAPVTLVELEDGSRFAGTAVKEAPLPGGEGDERLYRTANRDLEESPWTWVEVAAIEAERHPDDLVVLECHRWGAFHGRLVALRGGGVGVEGQREEGGEDALVEGEAAWQRLTARLAELEILRDELARLRDDTILPLAARLADGGNATLADELAHAQARLRDLEAAMASGDVLLESVDGKRLWQPIESILRAQRPNAMSVPDKLVAWGQGVWRFLAEGPRAANSAGGVWPAIFGTVLMVLLMSVLVTPFGVLAAIYLNEVAHQGRMTRMVRIAVRNLAGVPSIVYGVFGLGVFVYGIGGSLDDWFFADTLPSPTFGTGGLLWASLTLALLTLPVVIVATEEGLARIPDHQREGALALGATRLEMLTRVVLPMAMPAMLTGMILAVARAAGEVAPLMLVGVAKLAPQVPVDGDFPFLHLERKFMHLGYHIYDVAFHGSDVQSALPLVYATALLLVLVILGLNLTAIFMRHYLRTRHGRLPRH
ncbi:phosphate ABC transporter permease PstA [Halomonas sp. TRM85114]|uniref:phosphate ABC transporter permease PstA n=1 Tax=Halomonas jincaotanensis TaxID=2810616 RepID=UPI001BD5A089|nr:phosphate ABC transporter permease PstA [Halomonas jincaotanensis]MBS9403327.1 phosphate ABC transporter permease PstA [Halomonas jincaotanensis]